MDKIGKECNRDGKCHYEIGCVITKKRIKRRVRMDILFRSSKRIAWIVLDTFCMDAFKVF